MAFKQLDIVARIITKLSVIYAIDLFYIKKFSRFNFFLSHVDFPAHIAISMTWCLDMGRATRNLRRKLSMSRTKTRVRPVLAPDSRFNTTRIMRYIRFCMVPAAIAKLCLMR
jgi:hypothetical protein